MNPSIRDKARLERHTSTQFDTELEEIRERVLSMCGLVESQVEAGARALIDGDGVMGERVLQQDYRVNAFEVGIDELCTRIIAKRQPQASDLRFILVVAKTITDLERIGDEAKKNRSFCVPGRQQRPRREHISTDRDAGFARAPDVA